MNEKIIVIARAWQGASPDRRKELIREIVKAASPEGLKLLSQIISRDQDIEIRQSARKAYDTLRRYFAQISTQETEVVPPRAAPESYSSSQVAQILQWLESDDQDLEVRALQEAIQVRSPQVLEVLRQRFESFQDDRVKATFVKTIASIGSAEDIPIIYRYLEDPNPRVRANAIEALEILNHPNTYMIFVQWLGDSDNRVKANCIKALRKIGSDSVNRILEDMLQSDYAAYKESALYVISLYPSRQGLLLIQNFLARESDPYLVERAVFTVQEFAQKGIAGASEYMDTYFSDYQGSAPVDKAASSGFDVTDLDSEDRETVNRALSRILENRYQQYVPKLLEMLDTYAQDVHMCSFLVRILGDLGVKESFNHLIHLLNSADDRLRANTIEAIGRIGRGREYLLPFLQDPNNRARANTIVALHDMPDVDVSEAMYSMVAHPDPLYRRSVLYAIKMIRDPGALTALEQLLLDPEERIRSQALEVLQYYEICGIQGATHILQTRGHSLYP